MRCTSSGDITDRCVNKRNRNGFVSAPFCKPNGWYETPEEARARADYEQKLRAPLLAVRAAPLISIVMVVLMSCLLVLGVGCTRQWQ